MAQINASDVKRLREQTGVGMMDCKKALQDAEGNFDKAVEILRTKGKATAEKRAGKTAAEGRVLAVVKDGAGVNVELNCETDFVAKNEDFLGLLEEIAERLLAEKPGDLASAGGVEVRGKKLDETIEETTGTTGEKIVLRRFDVFDAADGFVQEYVHMGGRIGVLVKFAGADPSDEAVSQVAKDVAMQVAAMRPQWVQPSDIPEADLAAEREIQKQRAVEEGKPAEMADKIAEGRLNKYYKEVCLLEQPFVKESKKPVKKVLEETSKDLRVVAFSRFEVGEGLDAN